MFTKKYRPSPLVTSLRAPCVATSVSVTSAPTRTAPVGSVTVPVTVPVETDCAYTAIDVAKERNDTATASRTTRLLNISPPPGWAIGARCAVPRICEQPAHGSSARLPRPRIGSPSDPLSGTGHCLDKETVVVPSRSGYPDLGLPI